MDILLLSIVGISLAGAALCADGIVREIQRNNALVHEPAHPALSYFDDESADSA